LQTIENTSKELQSLLCEKCGFSPGTHTAIVDLCTNSGWYAANVRANNTGDADKDWRNVSVHGLAQCAAWALRRQGGL
jgi:hypothetical protein